MENVCDLQRTGTLKMQGFKRSTRPNLQSLREWLQHMATHPSLIKPPWVPAAVAAVASAFWGPWGQLVCPQTCADVGPWHTWKLSCGVGTSCSGLWRGGSGSLHLQPHHRGDTRGQWGPVPSTPVCHGAVLPSWGFGIQHSPVLQLGQLSWGWNSSLQTGKQPSAIRNHEPGRRKSGWL